MNASGCPIFRILCEKRGFFQAAQTSLAASQLYPRTLILENDNTARDEIGRPIDIAGRNVVKMSILFTCGSNS
jgi:hypothetical protein